MTSNLRFIRDSCPGPTKLFSDRDIRMVVRRERNERESKRTTEEEESKDGTQSEREHGKHHECVGVHVRVLCTCQTDLVQARRIKSTRKSREERRGEARR